MAILTGINKVKTAVFISGNGSNLRSLIKFSRSTKSPISIKEYNAIMRKIKDYEIILKYLY